jgi:hypothetical protein
MGNGGITISVGDTLPYLEQKFWQLFGKDAESRELAEWFKVLQTTALVQTASVQCLGMRDPVPFPDIYQPTRLIVAPDPDSASALLNENLLPVLITLRRPTAVTDLRLANR